MAREVEVMVSRGSQDDSVNRPDGLQVGSSNDIMDSMATTPAVDAIRSAVTAEQLQSAARVAADEAKQNSTQIP